MRILIPLFLIILILLLSTGPVAGQTTNGYYRVESNPSDAQVLVDTYLPGKHTGDGGGLDNRSSQPYHRDRQVRLLSLEPHL